MNLIWVKLQTMNTISHCLINIYIHIDVCVCTCDYVQVYMYFMYIHAYVLLTYMDLQGYKNAYFMNSMTKLALRVKFKSQPS